MMTEPDHPDLLKSDHGIAKNFTYWHRLASEGLVYVSEHPDDPKATERLNLAVVCEQKAKAAAINPIQEQLAEGLIGVAKRMHGQLDVVLGKES